MICRVNSLMTAAGVTAILALAGIAPGYAGQRNQDRDDRPAHHDNGHHYGWYKGHNYGHSGKSKKGQDNGYYRDRNGNYHDRNGNPIHWPLGANHSGHPNRPVNGPNPPDYNTDQDRDNRNDRQKGHGNSDHEDNGRHKGDKKDKDR